MSSNQNIPIYMPRTLVLNETLDSHLGWFVGPVDLSYDTDSTQECVKEEIQYSLYITCMVHK